MGVTVPLSRASMHLKKGPRTCLAATKGYFGGVPQWRCPAHHMAGEEGVSEPWQVLRVLARLNVKGPVGSEF